MAPWLFVLVIANVIICKAFTMIDKKHLWWVAILALLCTQQLAVVGILIGTIIGYLKD